MIRKLASIFSLALVLAVSPLTGLADTQSELTVAGRLDKSDSNSRMLYMGGEGYYLPRSAEVTVEGNRYADPFLLMPNEAVSITWSEKNGRKVIKKLHIIGVSPEIPR